MKFTRFAAAAMLFMSVTPMMAQLKLQADNVDEVLKAMTLEEKATLVVGTSRQGSVGGNAVGNGVLGAHANQVPGAAGTTQAIPRLGIPYSVLTDGPAGVRISPTREGTTDTFYATGFPVGTALACTWNQELVEEVGKSIGNEVLEYGCDVLLAPGMNIHRSPLCGRNFEYYSEDPFVTGKIAAAYVRGIQSNGVGTSIKHYAGNSQETNRTGVDEVISQRALREIYLKGFEIAVKESKPWTVMSSYNKLNGPFTQENKELLTTILRDEWGFDGIVMTDWTGQRNTAAQIQAGNDLMEPGAPVQTQEVIDKVKSGELSMADLDICVKRILQYLVKTPQFKGYKYSNKPDLKAHAAVTRQSATEGMVLLENKNTLPLKENIKNVAVYGVTSYDFIAGGTGSGNVNRAYTVSLLDGLKNVGYTIDAKIQDKYEAYKKQVAEEKAAAAKENQNYLSAFLPQPLPAEILPSAAELSAAVAANDAAIITFGRISGEFLDRTTDNFNLSAEEQNLLKSVCKAFQAAGKKVIVVLNIGGVIETASWKNLPDAVLLAWQAGQEGGNSVADVLTGKVSPSGKLPMTWPVNFVDHKSSENFPRAEQFQLDLSTFMGKEAEAREPMDTYDWTNYEEGIYVGYRYFDSFGREPLYPFGFGLSYTDFRLGGAKVSVDGTKVTAKLTVRNTGLKYSGKETVQLYVSAPAGSIDKEYQRLAAFQKTKLLAPAHAEEMTLCFDIAQLASYRFDDASYVLEKGDYIVRVGTSSRSTEAAAVLRLDKEVIVSKHQHICPVVNPFLELHGTSAAAEETGKLPVVNVSAADFTTVVYSYETPEMLKDCPARRFVDGLSTEEMAEIVVGVGQNGTGRFKLPGSVGNTTSKFWDRGLVNATLCDGPAGLRISRRAAADKDGNIKPLEMVFSFYDKLPGFVKKKMLGDEKKDTVVYQFATAFPVESALAQSWNTELLYEVGCALQAEMKEYGCTWWLAPAVNIHRNPLCGRNFEYFSEDPFLAGSLCAALTRGVQREEGFYVTVKHFACNNQEDNRNKVSSNVSERALREIYLTAFMIAVKEGGAKSIMTSYNRVNGVYSPDSYDLCTKVLRNEWGFDGVVMTDWFSTMLAKNASALAMKAGNDLIMPGEPISKKQIVRAVEKGLITREELKRCCCNVVKAIMDSALQKEYME